MKATDTAVGVTPRIVAGILGGAITVGLEWLVVYLAAPILSRQSVWVATGVVAVGLCFSAIILTRTRTNGAMADDMIEALRDGERLPLRTALARLVATCATLASGAPLGFEGPVGYGGAVVGDVVARRSSSLARREVMAAGVAGAVAALFRAPLAGALFAVEIPGGSLRRWTKVPLALCGSLPGFLLSWWRHGSSVRFDRLGGLGWSVNLLGAVITTGVAVGVVVELFACALRWVGRCEPRGVFLVGSTAVVAGIALLVSSVESVALATSPGKELFRVAMDLKTGAWIIALVLVARVIGITATVAARGCGGLAMPLLMLGGLTGRLVSQPFGVSPVVSVMVGAFAAWAAGYRIPIASIALAAEATRRAPIALAAPIAVFVACAISRTSLRRPQIDQLSGATESFESAF